MTTTHPVIAFPRATTASRGDVRRVLGAAFLDDPVFGWIVPDRAELTQVIEPVFDAFADAFARHDETHLVTIDGIAAGVAMWSPPGVAPVHADDEERLGARLAEVAAVHLERMGECTAQFEAVHPHEPHWYLQFLGVEPTRQGDGFGARLLRTVLERADEHGEAAYLEATTLRNRALYERHGFVCRHDIVLPDGPTAYGMWRDPR